MLAIKSAAALFALGLGGVLGTTGIPRAVPSAPTTDTLAAASVVQPSIPSADQLAGAVRDALQQRVRNDLDDAAATVSLGRLDVLRASGRSLEARTGGYVQLAGAESIPVNVVAVYDLADGRLESVEYQAHPVVTEPGAVDRAVRAAIGRRIGERIATDFADQPTRFELLEVERVGYGRHRTRLQGVGLTDFGAEGSVYTPFVAILDKHTGELVELTYDLVQEAPEATVAGI